MLMMSLARDGLIYPATTVSSENLGRMGAWGVTGNFWKELSFFFFSLGFSETENAKIFLIIWELEKDQYFPKCSAQYCLGLMGIAIFLIFQTVTSTPCK